MGHDLEMKACPRNNIANSNCISGGSCNHQTYDIDHISTNFTVYDVYWHVRNAHGHSGHVVALQLQNAIHRMKVNGYKGVITIGSDEWTQSPEVFMYHLERLLSFVERYPNATFLSDQLWILEPDDNDTDNDTDEDNKNHGENSSDNEHEDAIKPTYSAAYFQHPIKGQIKVDTFAKASEVFTYMSIINDPQAQTWLNWAKLMPDAPL